MISTFTGISLLKVVWDKSKDSFKVIIDNSTAFYFIKIPYMAI